MKQNDIDRMITKLEKNSAYGSFTKLSLSKRPFESNEEFVLRMMLGDFERHMGMSYDEFHSIRIDIIENYPEKLI